MALTARTSYWFWSDDLVVVDAERQFHQSENWNKKATEFERDALDKLRPFEK